MITQFLYVGAQVGTWSFFIQYSQEYAGVRERTAGLLLAATLAAFGLGRFVSASLMKRWSASQIMLVFAAINVLLLCLALTERNWIGVIAILNTSFFMSMMYPTIFALGLEDVGTNTKMSASLLVMMIVGGAVLTPLMGKIAQSGMARAYIVPLIAFAWVGVFAKLCDRKFVRM